MLAPEHPDGQARPDVHTCCCAPCLLLLLLCPAPPPPASVTPRASSCCTDQGEHVHGPVQLHAWEREYSAHTAMREREHNARTPMRAREHSARASIRERCPCERDQMQEREEAQHGYPCVDLTVCSTMGDHTWWCRGAKFYVCWVLARSGALHVHIHFDQEVLARLDTDHTCYNILKHAETIETYVCNICNIQIKHLQHTSETGETYTCNICNNRMKTYNI
jgi:hypothetical protein